MVINVTGQQFAWTYEYPQASGKPVKSTGPLPAEGPPRALLGQGARRHPRLLGPRVSHEDRRGAGPDDELPHHAEPPRAPIPSSARSSAGSGTRSCARRRRSSRPPSSTPGWRSRRRPRGRRRHGRRARGRRATRSRRATAAGAPAAVAPRRRRPTASRSSWTAAAAAATRSPTPARTATIGPDLDKVLKGKDAAFIKTSIADPSAEIAPGFQDGIMPKSYGDTLKPEELDALVAVPRQGRREVSTTMRSC